MREVCYLAEERCENIKVCVKILQGDPRVCVDLPE